MWINVFFGFKFHIVDKVHSYMYSDSFSFAIQILTICVSLLLVLLV